MYAIIVYSAVCLGEDQRKCQYSASLALARGIHRWPVNSPDKRPVTRKMFPIDKVFMIDWQLIENKCVVKSLTHWGRVTHICVGNLTIIGSNNGLSPGRRHAFIWTNAGILLIGPLGINFSEILIEINTFSFNKMHLKMSSAKWRLFLVGLNVLNLYNTRDRRGYVLTLLVFRTIIWIASTHHCDRIVVRRAGLLWSQQDFEWLWSVPLSSASLY